MSRLKKKINHLVMKIDTQGKKLAMRTNSKLTNNRDSSPVRMDTEDFNINAQRQQVRTGEGSKVGSLGEDDNSNLMEFEKLGDKLDDKILEEDQNIMTLKNSPSKFPDEDLPLMRRVSNFNL